MTFSKLSAVRSSLTAGIAFVVLAMAFAPSQAQAVITFGSSMQPAVAGGYACDNSCTYVAETVATAAADGATAPQAGVIVRWRVKFSQDPGGAIALRVLSRQGNNSYTALQRSAAVTLAEAFSVDVTGVRTFNTRLPVGQGQRLGLDCTCAIAYAFANGGLTARYLPKFGNPESRSNPTDLGGVTLLVNADVEQDVDGDGFGDETQDSDDDGDGFQDGVDNCSTISNPGQANADGDAQGDACDGDDDNDGVTDGADNCSLTPNAGQQNRDGDAQGDACDADDDGDFTPDGSDGCPLGEIGFGGIGSDIDGDGCRDATEDADDDGDGFEDASDNCPLVANPGQQNVDGDARGDACDDDNDNDGVTEASDNCAMVANPDQLNTDGDAQGDACDGDDDGDGVTDAADKCSTTPDAGQVNTDGDAQGDACDGDDDNDGIADGADGCPAGGAGGSGSDTDDDGCHDATEDADDDNDGVSDAGDNCALVANPGQQNADGDTQGDACDADRDGDGIADASDRCPDAGLVVGPDGCLLPTVGLPPVTTPPVRCRVPKLKGKTLGQARRMLKKRHCGLGKVRRPRAVRRGRKLVVAKQRTKAGTIHVAGRRVGLTLAYRRR